MIGEYSSTIPKKIKGIFCRRNLAKFPYSQERPVARGEMMKNMDVIRVGNKYGVSVPRLSIRYRLELGVLPLPKTASTDK